MLTGLIVYFCVCKKWFFSIFFSFIISANAQSSEIELNKLLDAWHISAAKADFNSYFNVTTNDFIFLGTAPGERWVKSEFQSFCKPYFDKGKAWDFKAVERHVYFSQDQKTVWFDELLSTWMKGCRGSGVLVKTAGVWKIKHYVLSTTIPNEHIDAVIQIKEKTESLFLQSKTPQSAQ
jgi:hypothetical protein